MGRVVIGYAGALAASCYCNVRGTVPRYVSGACSVQRAVKVDVVVVFGPLGGGGFGSSGIK